MVDKKKFIELLRKEESELPETNFFGEELNHDDYDKAVAYLETGDYDDDDYLCGEYPILSSLIDNIECAFEDYQ